MRYVLLATVTLSVIATSALADEMLKYRSVYYTTSIQSQNIPDVDGHIVAIVHATGVASFPDGSVAADNLTTTIDYTKGSGPLTGYSDMTFSDGSVLFTKSLSTATTEGQRTTFKGTMSIIGGKGRFAGAKGDGTLTGARLQPQPGAGAQAYVDVTLNIK
jgi:hypothetical protein